jgi:hypothetical protein
MNAVVDSLRAKYPGLPDAYFEYLSRNGGGSEGELSVEPGWFVVWDPETALAASDEYGLPEFLPGYFVFGGNGGGELFVLGQSGDDPSVFMVPAIGMEAKHLVKIAANFAEFERATQGGT